MIFVLWNHNLKSDLHANKHLWDILEKPKNFHMLFKNVKQPMFAAISDFKSVKFFV